MSDIFPVGMSVVEMQGMSVITFIALSFYSLGLFIGGAWFASQLKSTNNRIDTIESGNSKMLANLYIANTEILVAIAVLTEKVDKLEQTFLDK